MNKVTLYPITKNTISIVNAISILKPNINIHSIVIPKGYANSCPDFENVQIYDKVVDAYKFTDKIIFLPFWDAERMYNEMIATLEARVSVLCTFTLSNEQIKKLKTLASKSNVSFEYFDDNRFLLELESRSYAFSAQESVVVAVGSLTPKINSTETVLELAKALHTMGYRTTIVCSNAELRALGYPYIPLDIIVSCDLENTIMQINRFVNYVEVVYQPEIIILQLPDEGFFRMSNEYEFSFGARNYLLSQAISIDYGIILSPLLDADSTDYEGLSEISKYRFGLEYNAIILTNRIINSEKTTDLNEFDYLLTDIERLECEILEINKDNKSGILYTGINFNYGKIIAKDIVLKLS